MMAPLLTGCDLVADIGGTNARFAIHHLGEFLREQVLPCKDFARFADAFRHYCDTQQVQPARAAIAIANPVLGDRIQMTNHHWAFSIAETRGELGLTVFNVVNDFEALALSLPYLPAADLKQLGGSEPVVGAVKAVIGPGTGLGVASLASSHGHWQALPAEGGHVSFPARTAREWAMVECLAPKFDNHVSAERLISGPGLALMHQALAQIDGVSIESLTPAEITARALSNQDPRCHEVLELFCIALGNVAGNLALTVGARGGVYIGGGIVPKLGDFFSRSGFRAAFEDKGRFDHYLGPIPVYVIHSPYPAFVGAVRSLSV
ncbi:glucokinase [Permianibacter sp. IMCC34836]|uniref:glucokinase n=1 Tax=Permianibacter fluminis TaxID=2738515 RepID=UPI0015521222|nr:glucokinase [Permianibacter fluminis]NQD37497.1 glucokinase [Permianibacter fluminis]